MNPSNKKKKEQKQLNTDQMDDLSWRSTPLGKFLSSIKENTPKISRSGPSTSTDKKRSWVVRIPSAFVFSGSKSGGFQTIVQAENQDEAWEEASKCDEWEILDFFISHTKVFPKDPL